MIDPQYSQIYYVLPISAFANKPIPELVRDDSFTSTFNIYELGKSQQPSRISISDQGYQFIFLYNQRMGQFCYWDAKSLGDTIIMIVMVVFLLGIAWLTAIRLRRSRVLAVRGKKIIIIYVLVLTWCIICIGQFTYSIIVFFTEIWNNDQFQFIDPYSRNYVRFDILPGFIVQTIFLTICRFYYKGIMDAIEVSHLSKWQRNYIKYLDYYLIIRHTLQFMAIVLVNIFATTDEISIFSQINIWLLMSDSIITNIFLVLSLKIYLKATKFIHTIDQKDLKTFKIEYSLMIASSIIRLSIDIPFLIMPFFMNSNSQCIGDFSQHIMHAIFYNIIGNLINHFIPIIWILKIYNFQTQSFLSINQSSTRSQHLIKSQTCTQ